MTPTILQERLETCAAEIERGIETWRANFQREMESFQRVSPTAPWLWEGQTPEGRCDLNGRPVLAGMYADLARVYVALATLGRSA